MVIYRQIANQITREASQLIEAIVLWLDMTGPAERALGVSIFGLILMYFILKKPDNGYEKGGGMTRQFVFAMIVVVIMGFGVGWMFTPEMTNILDHLPHRTV